MEGNEDDGGLDSNIREEHTEPEVEQEIFQIPIRALARWNKPIYEGHRSVPTEAITHSYTQWQHPQVPWWRCGFKVGTQAYQ